MACLKATFTAKERQLKNYDSATLSEMKLFFSLYMAMGIVTQKEITDYWQVKYPITETPTFHQVMSRNCWKSIWSHLHFVNNATAIPRGEPGHDRLFKIRNVIKLVVSKFPKYYQATRELSLDEMTIAFKGRSTLKQYNPNKPDKWGYKAFVLSEANTGYALQMALYTGKTSDTDPKAVPGSVTLGVVQQLVSPHFGQGHILFTDSYYSSPAVADLLFANQTGFCGTCNANRTGMPHDIRPSNMPMKKGDDPAFRRKVLMLACTWQDIKRVTLLSTVDNNTSSSVAIHSRASSSGTRNILKPTVTSHYNAFMGGVDTLDQRCKTYLFPHRSRKWYKRIFNHLVQAAIVNAHIIYTRTTANQNRFDLKVFILEILHHYGALGQIPQPPRPQILDDRCFGPGHFPYQASTQRQCVRCSAKHVRKRTYYSCNICYVHLCLDAHEGHGIPNNCFIAYHTPP